MRGNKKLTVSLLLIVAASAIKSSPINNYETNYAPAHEYKEQDYSFSYGVKDMHTGDVKTQWEKKEGNVVTGHYSVLEADGSLRTVEYTADEVNGFNAVVKHNGKSQHPPVPYTSTHKETNQEVNHILSQPIQTEFKEYADESGHSYAYKESSPGISAFTYDKRKNPQQENNEISASSKYFNIKPVEQVITHTFKPSTEIRYEKTPIKYSVNYQRIPTMPKLPIDLSLLSGAEEIIPVDISQINPVEISLTEAKLENPINFQTTNSLPLHPSPEHELGIYFRDYSKINEPQLEKGFKPIVSTTPKGINTQNKTPNTFKSGKKPKTTPGLRHYSTKTKQTLLKPPPVKPQTQTFDSVHTRLMPLIFAKQLANVNNNQEILQKAEVIRLHPTKSKNGFVRYATHLRVIEEDK